jgi:hypothetical protein
MPRSMPLRFAIVAACISLAIFEAWWVFVRPTPALTIAGSHPTEVIEFHAGTRISQTFQMVGSNLDAIAVRFSTDEPVTFLVQCELTPITTASAQDDPAEPYRWSTTVKRVSGTEWRRLEFPAIASSHRQTYVFRMELIAAARVEDGVPRPIGKSPWPKVTVIASGDNVIGGGSFHIGSDRQVGSLSMRAFTRSRTAYAQYQTDVAPTLPALVRNGVVAVALAVVYQWALLTLAFRLLAGALTAPAVGPAARPQAL